MQRFAYTQPHTLAAATAVLAQYPNGTIKAGGVDLLDLLKERLVTPEIVVDISQVPECQGIRLDADTGALRIGSLTTFTQLAASAVVQEQWPALAQVAGGAATPQIRNQATLGGNLCQRPRCWYFRQEDYPCLKKGGQQCFALEGDNRSHAIFANQTCAMTHPSGAAVPLLAYAASVHVIDPKKGGQERLIPLADFFLSPEQDVRRENVLTSGEVITAIRVPRPAPKTGSVYLNLKHKQSFDWPIVEAAVVLVPSARQSDSRPENIVQEAHIVLGSVAPTPLRAARAEAVLQGNLITEAIADQAGQAATQGAAPLALNGEKIPLLAELVRRAVLKAAGKFPYADEVMSL